MGSVRLVRTGDHKSNHGSEILLLTVQSTAAAGRFFLSSPLFLRSDQFPEVVVCLPLHFLSPDLLEESACCHFFRTLFPIDPSIDWQGSPWQFRFVFFARKTSVKWTFSHSSVVWLCLKIGGLLNKPSMKRPPKFQTNPSRNN